MNLNRDNGAEKRSGMKLSVAQVKSASRVMELLEFARQIKTPFRALDLRTALNWPASSTQMILQTVVDSGYLIFNHETKQYFPSPRLFTIGNWLGKSEWNLPGALNVLSEIAYETGETVALSIENDYWAQCVKVVPGKKPIPFEIPGGYKAPLTSSAAGLAILMDKSDDKALKTMQRSHDLSSPEEESCFHAMKALHKFRREGRSVVYGRIWAESCWIAIPTPEPYHMVSATISVGGSASRMKRREDAIAEAMLAAVSRWHT